MTNYACEDYAAINAVVERERGVTAGMNGAEENPPEDCKNRVAWREGWQIGRAGRKTG